MLDPRNPPKLSLLHYGLLDKVVKKRRNTAGVAEPGSPSAVQHRSPSASVAAAQHPTVLNPALDAAISKLDALLSSAAAEDPEVREQLSQLRKRYRTAANPLAPPPSDGVEDGVTASSDPDLPSAHVTGGKLHCRFCRLRRRAEQFPSYSLAYTNVALLHQFINIRGMIYPRRLTGNCRRHQRRLAEAVKRARVMGLLAYTSNWRLPQGWQPVEGEVGYGALGQIVPEDAALGIMGDFMGEGDELDAADEDDSRQLPIDTEGYADFRRRATQRQAETVSSERRQAETAESSIQEKNSLWTVADVHCVLASFCQSPSLSCDSGTESQLPTLVIVVVVVVISIIVAAVAPRCRSWLAFPWCRRLFAGLRRCRSSSSAARPPCVHRQHDVVHHLPPQAVAPSLHELQMLRQAVAELVELAADGCEAGGRCGARRRRRLAARAGVGAARPHQSRQPV